MSASGLISVSLVGVPFLSCCPPLLLSLTATPDSFGADGDDRDDDDGEEEPPLRTLDLTTGLRVSGLLGWPAPEVWCVEE